MSPALSLTVQVGPSRWLLGKPKNLGFRSYLPTPHPASPSLLLAVCAVSGLGAISAAAGPLGDPTSGGHSLLVPPGTK